MTPAVTVLMAVRTPNADYFRDAVRSVLSQTFSDFELLIIEDPPFTDLLSGLDDPRIHLHRNDTRLGLAGSLKLGTELARAPLIARLDADDVCEPDRLERQLAFLREHPEVDVYGSRITIIDAAGQPIAQRLLPLTHDEIAAALRRYNCISHPSVMMRREAVLGAGGYDAGRAHLEDYELWCRMLTRGARFANSPQPLLRYRFHPGALKFQDVHREIRGLREIRARYFAGQLSLRDRLHALAERVLLLLPPRFVMWLFTRLQYRRS